MLQSKNVRAFSCSLWRKSKRRKALFNEDIVVTSRRAKSSDSAFMRCYLINNRFLFLGRNVKCKQLLLMKIKEDNETMKKIIILEGQKGFLFKNGKFIKMVEPGKYSLWGGKKILLSNVNDGHVRVDNLEVSLFEKDPAFSSNVTKCVVENNTMMIHFVDGIFQSIYGAGKYYFWNIQREHTFIPMDLSKPEIEENIPASLLTHPLFMPYVKRIDVNEKQMGILYFNHQFVRTLTPGTYFFKNGSVDVKVDLVDTCLVTQDIVGQEILTNDKVSLRINCVCSYRITNYVKVKTEIEDYKNELYIAVQLALRDYVGEKSLDEILASKKEMSTFLLNALKEKGKSLYLEIEEASIKDLILPGEIRDIMNTVLIAEKRAQANVITRREEVASTRSLLNTARLMDENATLYRLKELEYIERICEKIGSISFNGNGDLLSQLTTYLTGSKVDKK